jgi:hypothetical protein
MWFRRRRRPDSIPTDDIRVSYGNDMQILRDGVWKIMPCDRFASTLFADDLTPEQQAGLLNSWHVKGAWSDATAFTFALTEVHACEFTYVERDLARHTIRFPVREQDLAPIRNMAASWRTLRDVFNERGLTLGSRVRMRTTDDGQLEIGLHCRHVTDDGCLHDEMRHVRVFEADEVAESAEHTAELTALVERETALRRTEIRHLEERRERLQAQRREQELLAADMRADADALRQLLGGIHARTLNGGGG